MEASKYDIWPCETPWSFQIYSVKSPELFSISFQGATLVTYFLSLPHIPLYKMPRPYKNSLFPSCSSVDDLNLCRLFNSTLYFKAHSRQAWKRASVPVLSLVEFITVSNMATLNTIPPVMDGVWLGSHLHAEVISAGFFSGSIVIT